MTCQGTTQCQGYKMSCHRNCQGHICAQNLCQKVTATIIAMSTYRNLDLIQQTVFRKYIWNQQTFAIYKNRFNVNSKFVLPCSLIYKKQNIMSTKLYL